MIRTRYHSGIRRIQGTITYAVASGTYFIADLLSTSRFGYLVAKMAA